MERMGKVVKQAMAAKLYIDGRGMITHTHTHTHTRSDVPCLKSLWEVMN